MSVYEAYELYIQKEIVERNGSIKTLKNYRCSLHSLLRAIGGDFDITYLTTETVSVWYKFMYEMANSDTTIHHNLGRLRSVLKYLKRNGLNVLDYDFIDLPKIKQRIPSYIEPEEVRKIIDALPTLRDKALVACLFSTGCRISELLNLNRDDVKSREVVVLGKGSKYRTVFVSETAYGLLQSYLRTRKDKNPALFISSQYRRITTSRVAQIIHIATAEAGIDKIVTPHTFRHSFATDLVKKGANIVAVKDLLGHVSINTTQMYTHTNKPYLKNIYEKYHTSDIINE